MSSYNFFLDSLSKHNFFKTYFIETLFPLLQLKILARGLDWYKST